MIEKPYVNHLSGNTLPAYGTVKDYFLKANGKEYPTDLLKCCLLQGFEPEDVNLIILFYEDLIKTANDFTPRILSDGKNTTKVRFGELDSNNVSFDAPMQYLEDPSVIVAEVLISTNIDPHLYQGRDIGEHIIELETNLKGAGIESTINLDEVDGYFKQLSLSLTVPPYKDSQDRRSAYQKLIQPDYSRLDELVNAVELVQGAFQEIVQVQSSTKAQRGINRQLRTAAVSH